MFGTVSKGEMVGVEILLGSYSKSNGRNLDLILNTVEGIRGNYTGERWDLIYIFSRSHNGIFEQV